VELTSPSRLQARQEFQSDFIVLYDVTVTTYIVGYNTYIQGRNFCLTRVCVGGGGTQNGGKCF